MSAGHLSLLPMNSTTLRNAVETDLQAIVDLYNEASARLASKFGFERVGHLPEIAEVFGSARGLVINILRIPAHV